jgi:hypothetical protein
VPLHKQRDQTLRRLIKVALQLLYALLVQLPQASMQAALVRIVTSGGHAAGLRKSSRLVDPWKMSSGNTTNTVLNTPATVALCAISQTLK